MRILVDMDGVLADFEGHFLERWQAEHPDKPGIRREERTTFYITRHYPKEFHSLIWDILLAPGFFAALPPIPGGLDALRAMESLGHDVHICSSPLLGNPRCASDKYNWVEQHLSRDWAARLVLTSDKTLVQGDVLIDDRPDPTETGAFTPAWTHILYDQPYNRHIEDKPRLDWSNWQNVLFNGKFGK